MMGVDGPIAVRENNMVSGFGPTEWITSNSADDQGLLSWR